MSDIFTYSIPKTIKLFAQKNNISTKDIDFEITKYSLLHYHGRIYTPIEEILKQKDITYSNISELTGHIVVRYQILFSKNKKKYFSIPVKVATNKAQTTAVMVFKKGTKVLNSNLSEKTLLYEIRKIMAKNNLVPYVFDDELISGIPNLLNQFMSGELAEDVKLTLCKWPEFQKTVDAYTIMHCKKDSENGIYLVKEHDKILEMVYPKKGDNGHDVFGRSVLAKEPIYAVNSYTGNTDVKVEETESSKILYAKKRGYVKIEDFYVTVETVLKSSALSVKSTGGSIESSSDYNIEISVDSQDATNDGVGASMSLASEIINIDGVVGSGAVLTGKSVKVSQSTHKTSIIKAEEADIKVSRGVVYAQNATIDILEMGTVYAERVTVNIALGGKIVCKSANIKQLKCDIDIEAEEKVDFGSIEQGKHSIIEAKNFIAKKDNESEDGHEGVELQQELNKAVLSINRQIKKLKKIDLSIKSSMNSINAIKAIAVEDGKKGRKLLESHIKAIRNFNAKVANRKELANIIKEEKKLIDRLKQEFEAMSKEVQDLIISSKFGWPSPQKVKYKKDGEKLTLIIDKNSPSTIELINYFV